MNELNGIPRMIDTHCHLENVAFDLDRDSIIIDAKNLGISIITSSIDKETWDKSCKIAEAYPSVFASVGLDPTHFVDCDLVIRWLESNHERLVAIGETGLDHYLIRDHQERDLQEACFRKLISLSNEYQLPIQVHSRSAGGKALEVLESCDASKVHLHAFDGKASLARTASRDLGYYFSIPTSVVRSPQKQKLVKAVHIERLLLETDSPVLSPDKQTRNVPANLPIALKEVASILRREEEEVREIVLENTLKLYSKIKTN
ncbi:TatD family deoxyribonuclease [Candidatus Thorarchaeota archaeon]|nr:MAG: TatD family deoxyribonuclease [Candidatus Thorarchaeota archaeon]